LAAAGVLGGIALGVLVTVLVTGGPDGPRAAAPVVEPAAPAPVEQPMIVPAEPVIAQVKAAADPTALPSPPTSASAGAAPEEPPGETRAKASASKGSVATPRSEPPASSSAKGTRKKPAKKQVRDYGI
jgi:hypothetical protein